MKLSTLIVQAVGHELERNPSFLGVRLSPVALNKTDASDLSQEAPRTLGERVYIVISAPGVSYFKKSRVCTAPDHRAAEQATAWRNVVKISEGEHLVYISAEEHEKASGLRDCLFELTDNDLARAFLAWCETPQSKIPNGFTEAMNEAGLVERVGPNALCAFAEAVKDATDTANAWEVIGNSLHLLGLARDTGLRKANVVERLDANQRLVTRASAGEVRRSNTSGAIKGLEEQLREVARTAAGVDRTRALEGVDLGSVMTNQLRPPKRSRRGQPETQRDKPSRRPGRKRSEPESPSPGSEEKGSSPPLVLPKLEDVRLPGSKPAPAPRRPSVRDLPDGLTAILAEVISGSGMPVEWEYGGDARHTLASLPSGCEPQMATFEIPAELRETHAKWEVARNRLRDAIVAEQPLSVGIKQFVRARHVLLCEPDIRVAAEALVNAATAMYEAACKLRSEGQMCDVLALDTSTIKDSDGPNLRLLSPFHPLILGQALETVRGLDDREALAEPARSLLLRSLENPIAPPLWPFGRQSELLLSKPELGLVIYERNPEAVVDATLERFGQQFLRRYLSLCPHANFGMRIVVLGGDPSGLIEGLACAAQEAGTLQRLEVACQSSPRLKQSGLALASAGKLELLSVPVGEQGPGSLKPHVVLRLSAPAVRPEDEEVGDPRVAGGARGGLLQTEFEVAERGLRTRTSVDGIRVLEALEGLHANARGRRPRKEFVAEAQALSLSAALPADGVMQTSWHVAVGARLGRRPPHGYSLLIHEPIADAATCAAVSRDLRAGSRAVADGLRLLGIKEERSRALVALANRLTAAHNGGLLSLGHADGQLIAAGVLALELRRRAGDTPFVVARIEGVQHEVFLRESPERDRLGAVLLGLGTHENCLRVTVGYATLDSNVDVHFSKGQMGGSVGRSLGRLLEILSLSTRGTGLGSRVAREALAWLMWPAVATDGDRREGLVLALRAWEKGAPVESDVVCLLPAGLNGKNETSLRLGGVPVSLVSLDIDLFNRLLMSGTGT